jgi:hypothetical protein
LFFLKIADWTSYIDSSNDSKEHLFNVQVIFKNILNNLTWHHFIYQHITIHYNSSNANFKNKKNIYLKKLRHSFLIPQSWMDPSNNLNQGQSNCQRECKIRCYVIVQGF